MAYAFIKLNRAEESIELLTKSITEQLEEPTPFLTLSLLNMGITYNDEGLYYPAITFYEHAINNAIKFRQINLIAECCEHLYMLYSKIDKTGNFHVIITKILELKNNCILKEEQSNVLGRLLENYSEYLK
jgi:tetratricopeptide (TPR) repeat protein